MAPGCSAGRLSLCSVVTICFMIYLICQEVSSLITYDRLSLLEIGGFDRSTYHKLVSAPPCLEEILAFLRRPPSLLHVPLRRRRRRGKRGGLRIRLRAHLRLIRRSDRCRNLHFLDARKRTRDRWIRLVFPDAGGCDSVSVSCCCPPPVGMFLPGDAVWTIGIFAH